MQLPVAVLSPVSVEHYLTYLLEHLQREGPVFDQPLTLLRRLQAELAGLGLQSRHLLLNDTTQTESLTQAVTIANKVLCNFRT